MDIILLGRQSAWMYRKAFATSIITWPHRLAWAFNQIKIKWHWSWILYHYWIFLNLKSDEKSKMLHHILPACILIPLLRHHKLMTVCNKILYWTDQISSILIGSRNDYDSKISKIHDSNKISRRRFKYIFPRLTT